MTTMDDNAIELNASREEPAMNEILISINERGKRACIRETGVVDIVARARPESSNELHESISTYKQ